jgi:pimeloyl-ACP methyl ester carboxylesterase
MVSYDRPGYGYSEFGHAETSIDMQAEVCVAMLEKMAPPRILLGASYGGPIAAAVAMKRPDLVDGLILAAPAVVPGGEKIYNVSHVAKWLPGMVPRMFRVANAEKLSHERELKKMLPYWCTIEAPVVHIQGLDDHLIFPENIEFLKDSLICSPPKTVAIENQTHFLSGPQRQLITSEIIELANRIRLSTHNTQQHNTEHKSALDGL